MKTAEDWAMELAEKLVPDSMANDTDKRLPYIKAMEIVKQIKLDAWKQGMSDAAEIAHRNDTPVSLDDCLMIADAILTAHDNKTTI